MGTPQGSKLRIYSGFNSHVGQRERNEDALYQSKVPLGYLAAVADGMGGHEEGDMAAGITLAALVQEVQKEATDPARALRKGFEVANAMLRSRSTQQRKVLGATCAAALISNGQLHVGHVGDARLYLLRGATLYWLTRDHSLMQEISDIKGPAAAAEFAPNLKHIMSRSVGAEDEIKPDLRDPIPVTAGDTILLCTDGLTNSVDERRIKRILAGATPREAARRLIETATQEGAEDNVTVIILRVDTDAQREEGRFLSFEELTSLSVRTADGDLHRVVDAIFNPQSWALAALKLDLGAAVPGASCEVPISDIGPVVSDGNVIVSPQRTEALLSMYRTDDTDVPR